VSERSAAWFEQRARVLKALAHPSRLYLLALLSAGERCVCQLTPLVGADQSTVSKHLALLKSVGLVADRRSGVQVFYRMRRAVLHDAVATLEALTGGPEPAPVLNDAPPCATAQRGPTRPAEESLS